MLRKEKMLISLMVVTLIVLLFGGLNVFATDVTSGNNTAGTVTITATSSNNSTNNTNTSNTNTNTDLNATVSGTVNNTTNNTSNNTSTYNSTTNSSSLPYAGTSSSVVFIVLAFVASAIYAYKKVSDYNV